MDLKVNKIERGVTPTQILVGGGNIRRHGRAYIFHVASEYRRE
jgi:hypothetical protein